MNVIILIVTIVIFLFVGCTPARSIITDPKVSMKSSIEEISKNNNRKANIVKKLPKKIGSMELYNVVDYTKRFLVGTDMGYGIFYDLKNKGEGSGNIFLYRRYQNHVIDGLSMDALEELKVERNSIEKLGFEDLSYSTAKFNNVEFYKTSFITPPDSRNLQFDCNLFITGYNGVYLKVLFYYPANSEYTDVETNLFMQSLVDSISTG